MTAYDWVEKPTLLLDESRARANIARMAEKARRSGLRFRPHFKTHQSVEIGTWFRAEGVQQITVSSVEMGQYFAAAGWDDILLAFSVNWRQRSALIALAQSVRRLGLLVESAESLDFVERLGVPVDVWLKIDVGARRTGLDWQAVEQIADLLHYPLHTARLRGLLTHAGHTYGAGDGEAVRRVYAQSVQRMNDLRWQLQQQTGQQLEVSVGDTPGCSLSEDLGDVDEIRPGNFVFYDAEQAAFGSCPPEWIAVAVACPVVACHPRDEKVVVYGGAVHLSKDFWIGQDGQRQYGWVALPEEGGWSAPLPGAYVQALSQEHGLLHVPAPLLKQIKIGDLVCVLPAHSCLTAAALGRYATLDGRWIEMMR